MPGDEKDQDQGQDQPVVRVLQIPAEAPPPGGPSHWEINPRGDGGVILTVFHLGGICVHSMDATFAETLERLIRETRQPASKLVVPELQLPPDIIQGPNGGPR